MPKIVDKDAMRQKILEAAFGVFAERGYHAAKMTDIATAAGLAKGTLYIYFKSKEVLTTSLVRMIFRGLEQKITENGDVETLEQFIGILAHSLDAPEAELGQTRMFFEVLGPSFSSPDGVAEIARFFDRLGDYYCRNLMVLRAAGEIHSGINPQAYGRMIASMVDGMVTHRAMFGIESEQYGAMIEQAVAMMAQSLRPESV